MRIYRVGGSVRDEFLGHQQQDRDYVVLHADEAAFVHRFPQAKRVGRDSPVFILDGDEYTLSAAPDIASDLDGRDLTVNAVAREVQTGEVYSHPLAFGDMQARRLRPVAAANFLGDPLRVYRAARFAAAWPAWCVTPELSTAMRAAAAAQVLGRPAAERIGGEVRRALVSAAPSRFLGLLYHTGCLGPWFFEWCGAAEIPAGPPAYHSGSVLAHTSRVLDAVAGTEIPAWMGWCHDLGKTQTPPAKWPHHYHHEHCGAELAHVQGHRLRLPQRLILAGSLAARWHMLAKRYQLLRPGTKLDLLLRVHHADVVESLSALAAADGTPGVHTRMRADLKRVLAVRLPPEKRNRGQASGEYLRQLQIQALRGG